MRKLLLIPISLVLIESKEVRVEPRKIVVKDGGCSLEIVRDRDADIDANRLREATRKIVELVDICPENISGGEFNDAIGDVAIAAQVFWFSSIGLVSTLCVRLLAC